MDVTNNADKAWVPVGHGDDVTQQVQQQKAALEDLCNRWSGRFLEARWEDEEVDGALTIFIMGSLRARSVPFGADDVVLCFLEPIGGTAWRAVGGHDEVAVASSLEALLVVLGEGDEDGPEPLEGEADPDRCTAVA